MRIIARPRYLRFMQVGGGTNTTDIKREMEVVPLDPQVAGNEGLGPCSPSPGTGVAKTKGIGGGMESNPKKKPLSELDDSQDPSPFFRHASVRRAYATWVATGF